MLAMVSGCTSGPPPLAFSPETLSDATVGVAYDATITVSGNVTPVFLFSVDNGSLPPGLEIKLVEGSTSAGHIFGTPQAAGTFTFTVGATCFGTNVNGQTGSRPYTLVVR